MPIKAFLKKFSCIKHVPISKEHDSIFLISKNSSGYGEVSSRMIDIDFISKPISYM